MQTTVELPRSRGESFDEMIGVDGRCHEDSRAFRAQAGQIGDVSARPPEDPFPRFDPDAERELPFLDPATLMQEMIRKVVAAYNAELEEACQRSLTDPDERGVLVTKSTSDPSKWKIELSGEVPWGEIHERYTDEAL